MSSATEYAKLYGQANSTYCQGNLEGAAVIVKDMIAKYPNDANVILLQGHIHLGLQQYELAEQCYQKVLQSAKNSPDPSDLVDFAQRGLERIRQLPFEAEAGEVIAHSEANWQNQGTDWDSGFFDEDDIGESMVTELFHTNTLEETTFAINPELTHQRAAKTSLNQGRVTQKKDEDLDGFSRTGATDLSQDLGDSDLSTSSGEEALSSGFTPEPSAPLNASSDVGELNSSHRKIANNQRDSHLANAASPLLKPVVEVNPGKLAFFVNASLGKKQLILAALAGVIPVL